MADDKPKKQANETAETEVSVPETPRQGSNFIKVRVDYLTKILLTALVWMVGVAIVITLVIIGGSAYEYQLQTQLDELSDQLTVAAKQIEAESAFTNQFLTLQSKLQLLTEQNSQERMVEFFPILSALLPEGVVLESMSVTPEKITIIASAATKEEFADYALNLRSADGYQFSDGVILTMNNLNFREISQDTSARRLNPEAPEAYSSTIEFLYTLKTAESEEN
ncbi:PilN domain-containing protein [bacterium]|nr:PilN domain-containing protein [bacterium]